MVTKRKPDVNTHRKRPPATTPEARENQMIALAMDLVEKRLMDGSASSQETTHFLKLATKTVKLGDEILEKQKDLIVAKTEAIQSTKKMEAMYEEAMKALSTYKGSTRGAEDD